MYNYPVMRQVPPRIVKFDYTEPPSTTTIAVYIYGRQDRNNKYPDNVFNSIVDPVDVKFLAVTPILYGVCTTTKREPLLPLPSLCATTSTTTIPRTSTSSTSHRLDPPRKRTLRRYNPEATLVNECMCVV